MTIEANGLDRLLESSHRDARRIEQLITQPIQAETAPRLVAGHLIPRVDNDTNAAVQDKAAPVAAGDRQPVFADDAHAAPRDGRWDGIVELNQPEAQRVQLLAGPS